MRAAAAFAALLLPACAPAAPQIPDSSPCEGNSAPFIGNLSLDSACVVGADLIDCLTPEGQDLIDAGEESACSLTILFQWADPGVAGAADPPNMVGGMISAELSIAQFNSLWISDVEDGAPVDDRLWAPVDRAATQGEFGMVLYPEEILSYHSPATINLRVRDACDAESNNIGCRYLLGTGEWIDCVPPASE